MPQFSITRRDFGRLGTGLVCVLANAADTVASRLHIADDGIITVMTGKVELGQGIRTILTQVAAEELRVPVSRIRLLMGDTALCPDDGGTWASLTSPQTVPAVRAICAAARESGSVKPGEMKKIAGTSLPNVNSRSIVTGALKYASDLKRPGMRHGKVIRPPGYRSTLVSVQSDAQVMRDGNLIGVLAADARAAGKLAATVKTDWRVEPLPSRDEMFARIKEKSVAPKPGEGGRYPSLITEGDVMAGLAAVTKRHEAQYTLANIAHVALECRTVIAEWKDENLTVWSGTQAPFMVRKELAGAFHIPEERIRVIAIETGGAFGGKQRGECEVEAARLARDAGAPVRLSWTREEEFTAAYCRPAGIVEMAAGLDSSGRIHAWRHRNYNSGAASLRPPYAIPHFSCEYHRSEAPLHQGSYRSLAGVANTFARESHVDALAGIASKDALEFRLRNTEDARLREALERAAERFGWGRRTGAAEGLACNLEKDGRLALFVAMDGVRVRRMVLALDVGAILNPDMLRNQATGALIQGIGGALFEELTFDARHITNARLSKYRVPRFADAPDIEVILIDHPEIPSAGSGEAPITVVAPAIAAALRRQSGEALRSLPLL